MTRGTANACPHPTCPNQKPYGHYACKTHWYSLPSTLRNRISDTWRRKDMTKWLEADKEALAFWNEKLGGTTANLFPGAQ